MGGGGVCGLVYVGVFVVMEEEGVLIDVVGGTFIGVMVGGMYVCDFSVFFVCIMVMKFVKEMFSVWGCVIDFIFFVVSYFIGWGMNCAFGINFGETKIEDCWLSFFCCMFDLILCMLIVY